MVEKGVIEDDYRFYQLEIMQRGGVIQKHVDERTTHVVAVSLTCAFEEISYVEVSAFPLFENELFDMFDSKNFAISSPTVAF